MKSPGLITLVLCLLYTGCSSRSDEAYGRLLQLAGLKNSPSVHKTEFIKTSGIDPYYLARIETAALDIVRVPELFESPGDWQTITDRYVVPPSDIEWWRPTDLQNMVVWIPKKQIAPSYTEVAAGKIDGKTVIYVAWLKHSSF